MNKEQKLDNMYEAMLINSMSFSASAIERMVSDVAYIPHDNITKEIAMTSKNTFVYTDTHYWVFNNKKRRDND